MPDREVSYAFTVKTGPAARDIDNLITKSRTLKNELAGAGGVTLGRGAGGGASGAAGGGGGGVFDRDYLTQSILGRRIIPGLTAALAVHMARESVQFGAAAMKTHSDPFATEYQQQRVMKESLPIIGGFVKDWLAFVDELAGWGPRFREIQRSSARAMQSVEIEAKRQQFSSEANLQQRSAEVHRRSSTAMFGASMSPMAQLFLTSADPHFQRLGQGLMGQFGAQRDLTQALDREATIKTDFDVAKYSAGYYSNLAGRQQRELRGVNPKTEEDQLRVDKLRADYAVTLEKAQKEIERVMRLQKDHATAAKDVESARNKLSEANQAMAHTRIEMLQNEQQMLRRGVAEFGMLRPEEQGAAVRAAERMKQFGPQVLTDRERALVGRAGLFDKMTEEAALRAGRESPLLGRALGAAGLRGFEEIEGAIQNVKLQLDVRFLDMANAADEFAAKIIPEVKRVLNLEFLKGELEKAAKENEQFQRKSLSPSAGK